MVVRIVIAGDSQDEVFTAICLIADYLGQNLPDFCWKRVEYPISQWVTFLHQMNKRNNWHHLDSPLVWKEMLNEGSKPFYIGGASEFLEYCHSYYNVDVFLTPDKIEKLTETFGKFKTKLKLEKDKHKQNEEIAHKTEITIKTDFVVTICGARNILTTDLISGLVDLTFDSKCISKIYLYDHGFSREVLNKTEKECAYVESKHATKAVRYIEKLGIALATTDLLIILNHEPFDIQQSIGDWLVANRRMMVELSTIIKASASKNLLVLFPNLGPACFNATVLSHMVKLKRGNIAVATSDLGLNVSSFIAEIAEIPLKNMFCPPVWGFVGINHLVDVQNTVHRYDTFEPYKRYVKVKSSSLTIGSLTPEFRTMEYLLYFDESLWRKVVERNGNHSKSQLNGLNKILAVIDVVKEWLFEQNPQHIVGLGIECDGSFGLTFNGIFSQPARFRDGKWEPASDYLLPKDRQMPLRHLQEMAEFAMNIKEGELATFATDD